MKSYSFLKYILTLVIGDRIQIGSRAAVDSTGSVSDGQAESRLVCRLLNADWRINMPGNHHLRGVSDKEQRQYEHIKESAEKSGRYGGRAKEVAARTVMKEHKQKGHKKGS